MRRLPILGLGESQVTVPIRTVIGAEREYMTNHVMVKIRQYPTGAEKWGCPTCGKQVIMIWSPFRRITLHEGDPDALHSGCKGGLEMNACLENAELTPPDDPRLEPYRSFFGTLDEKHE